MIARGFKSVIWVATVGSAALGCYMVSLRVATERNELLKVERQIIEARSDIRTLQTELGTRGRMTQLEQWNAEVLALAAPSSQQFLKDEFTLARLYREDPTVAERSAEVRLASAEAPAAKPAEAAKPQAPAVVRAVADRPAAAAPLIHRASFTPAEPAKPAAVKPERGPAAAPTVKPAKPTPLRTASARVDTSPAAKPAAKPGKPGAVPARADAKPAKAEGTATRTAAKPAKPDPASVRTAAKPAKAEATASRSAAKPVVAAAKPVREAAAAPRQPRVKGSGGN
ncbi:MAG TPA: hypothetical protein VF605_12380 [Allosphingosinicella sp.]|jgi:hypothetical protein